MNFVESLSSKNTNKTRQSLRRRLHDSFGDEKCNTSETSSKVVDSSRNSTGSRRMLATQLMKPLNNVQMAVNYISQKLRSLTNRHDLLEEGAMTPGSKCATPRNVRVREVLGRTPTELYPFGIETPELFRGDKENRDSDKKSSKSRKRLKNARGFIHGKLSLTRLRRRNEDGFVVNDESFSGARATEM